MKVALEKEKNLLKGTVPWTACEPFVENNRAKLIHRVRYVTTHKIGPKYPAHLAVRCWCGNGMVGTKKFTFLASPPDESILCARCEEATQKFGLPSSHELAGRHVHIGRLLAVRDCCDLTEATP